jgi:nucleoid DNA-binding protein
MVAKAATKGEILAAIAAATELSRKQVASVFDALAGQVKKAVGKKGPGVFVIPGLAKVTVIQKGQYHLTTRGRVGASDAFFDAWGRK